MRTGIIVLALAGLGCGLRGDLGEAERSLPKELARAKAHGYPMTADEFSPPKSVADDKNGAEILKLLQEPDLKKQLDNLRTKSVEARRDAPPINLAILRESVSGAEEVFKVIERSASEPVWWFKYDFDMGPHVMFPEFALLKDSAKALVDRAQVRASDGNISGAVEDLARIRTLSEKIAHEGMLIGILVEIAMISIQQKAVVDIAATCKDNSRALVALAKFAKREAPRPNLTKAMLGEYYMGLTYLRNFDKFGGLKGLGYSPDDEQPAAPKASELQRSGEPKDPVARAYLSRHLQFWNDFADAKKSFGDDPRAASKWLDERAQKIATKNDPSYMVSKVLSPVFSQAGQACLRPTAATAMSRAYIAALIERKRTGSVPNSLRTETDPFDGKPIRYAKTATGFKVWSVSADGKDNGGQRKSESGERDDVVEYVGK